MKKVTIKALEINEKDNLSTAFGKGMLEGVIDGSIKGVVLGAAFIVGGKLYQQLKPKQENEAE